MLVFSASNDSDCWCVASFRVREGSAKSFSLAGPMVPHFLRSLNVTSDTTPKIRCKKDVVTLLSFLLQIVRHVVLHIVRHVVLGDARPVGQRR